MSKLIIYDREINDHIPRWLNGLIEYFKNKNFEVELCHRKTIPDFANCKLFIIWNGSEPIHQPILNEARQNSVRILFAECAWFPQSKFYYLDENGINADCSLMDDISWVTDEHIKKLEQFKKNYISELCWKSPGKYIIVPLQLDNDTNIIKNAPFKNMQSFINHAEESFPNDFILFKTHPVLPNLNYKVKGTNALVRNGNLLEFSQDAKLAYGQTSTALLETCLMGVPTIAIGNCFLSKHRGHETQLLAALIDRQIPVGEINLDYWMNKYVR
jgi:hypothetical protein